MKFQFLHEHRHLFPIIRRCQVLEGSEHGYYNWRKRGKCQRKQDDEQLSERSEDAYHTNRGASGSPRIHAELKGQGIHCGRKRIARSMRELQISARKKRRKARTTESTHSFPIAPNLLKRDFTADAPNKKWMTDITFIEIREGWLRFSGVVDAYSCKIVGWAMGKHHDAELVITALRMARKPRQPGADLIHHSDQGSEDASTSYQMLLHEHNIQVSMRKNGNCYDTALVESFWATVKKEWCEQALFSTRNEAKTAIFECLKDTLIENEDILL